MAQQFTGFEGKYVQIADTIRGFKEIVEGKHDALPEQAFYMVGTIEDAIEKAKKQASIPKSLALDISTPDKPIVHDEVDEVQLPGYRRRARRAAGSCAAARAAHARRALVPQGPGAHDSSSTSALPRCFPIA